MYEIGEINFAFSYFKWYMILQQWTNLILTLTSRNEMICTILQSVTIVIYTPTHFFLRVLVHPLQPCITNPVQFCLRDIREELLCRAQNGAKGFMRLKIVPIITRVLICVMNFPVVPCSMWLISSWEEKKMLLQSRQMHKKTASTSESEIDIILCVSSACNNIFFPQLEISHVLDRTTPKMKT